MSFQIYEDMHIGAGHPLLLIAGPCQLESFDHCMRLVEELRRAAERYRLNFIFKASFDKANRTSAGAARGPGLDAGLQILAKVREAAGVPVLTDIHLPEQAEAAAQCVDVLQIPAFLCRQTDLLAAAGRTGKAVQIKKGQFVPPEDMRFCAEKVTAQGNSRVLLCERGTCFGYRDLVVDMRGLCIMRSLGYPVVFDATHSVQVMGGQGGASGGQRAFIQPLARAAAAAGIDGLFIECHEAPERAPSDSASMLPLSDLDALLKSVTAIREAAR